MVFEASGYFLVNPDGWIWILVPERAPRNKTSPLDIKREIQGCACSVIRPYILPLKTDHPGVVLVTADLDGPLDEFQLMISH